MKFYQPSEILTPYVLRYGITEISGGSAYPVFPQAGAVFGFQYKGHLHKLIGDHNQALDIAGVSGISDAYSLFTTDVPTGSVLIYFTPGGFSQFTSIPMWEFFNRQISLRDIFPERGIDEVEEKMQETISDSARIRIVEQFLLGHLSNREQDFHLEQAVTLIKECKGMIGIEVLSSKLHISQSPLEKRFKNRIGTSPKKFATIIRMQSAVADLKKYGRSRQIGFDHGFFDQAHFIKAFKKFTGTTPTQFTERK